MPIAQTISKTDARAALSHARQIARAKERAHQERLTAGYKAKKASNVIQLRSQAKITSNEAVVAKREEIRAAHQVENDQRRLQQATSTQPSIPRRAAGATVSGISYAGQSANRSSSPAGALFLIMFVIAALILWYYVVSHPQTSGFLGKLGDILHAVSSTQPLFSAITNTQASVPSEGVGVGAVGTPPAPSSPPTP